MGKVIKSTELPSYAKAMGMEFARIDYGRPVIKMDFAQRDGSARLFSRRDHRRSAGNGRLCRADRGAGAARIDVRIEAWQADRNRPVASCWMNFLPSPG